MIMGSRRIISISMLLIILCSLGIASKLPVRVPGIPLRATTIPTAVKDKAIQEASTWISWSLKSAAIGFIVFKIPLPSEVSPPMRMGVLAAIVVGLILGGSLEKSSDRIGKATESVGGSLEKGSSQIKSGLGTLGFFVMIGSIFFSAGSKDK